MVLSLGVLLKLQWKLSEALERYDLSLEICKKMNNRWGMSRLYNNMANIYEMTMDFEKAIQYQKDRLELAKQLEDQDGLVKSCACIAAMYHTLHDHQSAIE